MGVERLKAKLENAEARVGLVYVDDDVSLEGQFGVTTGRRGLAGGILILHVSIKLTSDLKSFKLLI